MIVKYLIVIIFTHFSFFFYLQQLATMNMVDKNMINSEGKSLNVTFSQWLVV